ncbi:hypothetical protein ACFXGO_33405 [Streptomyces roseus]
MRTTPRPRAAGGAPAEVLNVLGSFAEVRLAKEGHDGVVGVNHLEEILLATATAVFGAILAGVDHVLVGAGVPARIPALADRLARCEPCVSGSPGRATSGPWTTRSTPPRCRPGTCRDAAPPRGARDRLAPGAGRRSGP